MPRGSPGPPHAVPGAGTSAASPVGARRRAAGSIAMLGIAFTQLRFGFVVYLSPARTINVVREFAFPKVLKRRLCSVFDFCYLIGFDD